MFDRRINNINTVIDNFYIALFSNSVKHIVLCIDNNISTLPIYTHTPQEGHTHTQILTHTHIHIEARVHAHQSVSR